MSEEELAKLEEVLRAQILSLRGRGVTLTRGTYGAIEYGYVCLAGMFRENYEEEYLPAILMSTGLSAHQVKILEAGFEDWIPVESDGFTSDDPLFKLGAKLHREFVATTYEETDEIERFT